MFKRNIQIETEDPDSSQEQHHESSQMETNQSMEEELTE